MNKHVLPTTQALKEAESLRRILLADLRDIANLRNRIKNDARSLLSEMALAGGRLERVKEILPEREFKDFLKSATKHGDTEACVSIFISMSRGENTEFDLFAALKIFERKASS